MNFSFIRYTLGKVLMINGAFMLLPFIVGMVYGEREAYTFLSVAILSFVIGFLASLKKYKNPRIYAREGFFVVAFSWIAVSIIGALTFYFTQDNGLTHFTDCMFEMVSGFTTTGASVIANIEGLSHAVLIWRSFSHWIGGMGILVFLLAIIPMTGGSNIHLMKTESPGPTVSKLVPKIRTTAKILYLIYIAMSVAMIIILLIAKTPLFDALYMTFSTAGTGGFGIYNDSLASYTSIQQVIVLVFMLLFGVNFNAYFAMIGKNKKHMFRFEEIRWYFGIFAVSAGIIFWQIYENYESVGEAIKDSAFQVASIMTSTGFATTNYNGWHEGAKMILIMLMFVGACAGSTGGGIKVSRVVLLFKTVRRELARLTHPRSVRAIRFDKKVVEEETIRQVLVYLAAYMAIFVVSLVLVSFDGNDMIANFSGVASALNNTGPVIYNAGTLTDYTTFSFFSKWVYIFDMLAGRLEIFPILVLLSKSMWKKSA